MISPRLCLVDPPGALPPDPRDISSKKKAILSGALLSFILVSPVAAEGLVLAGPEDSVPVTVSKAEAVFMHGMPSVQFLLTEGSSQRMSALTASMIGEEMAISLCDHVLVQATVRERISGRGVINVPSIEIALAVAEVLSGTRSCAELDPFFDE